MRLDVGERTGRFAGWRVWSGSEWPRTVTAKPGRRHLAVMRVLHRGDGLLPQLAASRRVPILLSGLHRRWPAGACSSGSSAAVKALVRRRRLAAGLVAWVCAVRVVPVARVGRRAAGRRLGERRTRVLLLRQTLRRLPIRLRWSWALSLLRLLLELWVVEDLTRLGVKDLSRLGTATTAPLLLSRVLLARVLEDLAGLGTSSWAGSTSTTAGTRP